MVYSAAMDATWASWPNARSTRSSNPGLFGSKPLSRFFSNPSDCAAWKIFFRRTTNFCTLREYVGDALHRATLVKLLDDSDLASHPV